MSKAREAAVLAYDKSPALDRREECNEVALNAAIDAFLGALSEDGLAIVPKEPSEAMLDAGVLAADSRDRWPDNARNIYCAMVNSISSKS